MPGQCYLVWHVSTSACERSLRLGYHTMADSDSDSWSAGPGESEISQLDNASPRMASSFATLQNFPTQRIVDDRSWQDDPRSIPRTKVRCGSLHHVPEGDTWEALEPPPDNSSMALTYARSSSSYSPQYPWYWQSLCAG